MISKADIERAPCLEQCVIGGEAKRFVTAFRNLSQNRASSVFRALSIVQLFDSFEAIAESGEDPLDAFKKVLLDLTKVANEWERGKLGEQNRQQLQNSESEASDGIPETTGRHYGRLFEGFSEKSFWDEPKQLLETRLIRNGIPAELWKSKTVLDAGCGGGRYTVAWKLLGAENCLGLDISKLGIGNARSRVAEAEISGVHYCEGSVLDINFSDGSFDVVFSNGVLHHTSDWKKGVSELVRVMKGGGFGWLYLIENPGGLFWDMIEILRLIVDGEDRSLFRKTLALLGLPQNRVFYLLDHVMVPINLRLSSAEILQCLERAGATDIRRLDRGTDFDRIEQIYQRKPFAEILYGVGENRFVFSK